MKSCPNLPYCGWFTFAIPWCYDKSYVQVTPLTTENLLGDTAKRFFNYNFGVHLGEGTSQRIIYNVDHIACAEMCLTSASGPAQVRCLSFDFYAFPYLRTPEEIEGNGVCVLNTDNSDTGRLRNVDEGYTDEELYALPSDAGHFRHRSDPFTGYYEVRDPRGGSIASQLDYPGDADDLNAITVWAGSRWGVAHYQLDYVPPQGYTCNLNTGGVSYNESYVPPTPLTFTAGYTPVLRNQHCPGLVAKADAAALCASTGGFLCPNQATVRLLNGRKLGCSYDGFPMWAASDSPNNPNQKFVRCCAAYKDVDNCDALYSQSNLDFCSQFTTFHNCVTYGSGYQRQFSLGFGVRLQQYRNDCANYGQCTNVVKQDYAWRDRCVWCLEPGVGGGYCRAGNQLGVCASSDTASQVRFAANVANTCGAEATCRVVAEYPDLCNNFPGVC